ncbi:DinB family protein [Echinicola jeungdonensis]|uniref:DinB family protein n=1 Tax=Echinicola jeungdonensis TaxID=709343 RepID=UPI0025B4ADF7|nr:DinB family protein [Echinicola jeungdonensis]MDN3670332.1 DinB family protein [Echinicola jeungdonensis]
MNEKLMPESNEYGSFYETYISYVRGKDPLDLMLSQIGVLREYFVGVTEEVAQSNYDDGKWSYKEVIGHINDTEKIMLYRALCIARNEKIKLPGYEQEEYVKAANFNQIPLAILLDDFEQSRKLMVPFLKIYLMRL